MITAAQMRAARALLGIDQRQLAERAGLSLPTIQRMEASDGVVRGNVDSLMKLVGAPLAYIRGPFVAEGLLQGGAGALLALALLWITFTAGRARFGQLASEALGIPAVSFLPAELSLMLLHVLPKLKQQLEMQRQQQKVL